MKNRKIYKVKIHVLFNINWRLYKMGLEIIAFGAIGAGYLFNNTYDPLTFYIPNKYESLKSLINFEKHKSEGFENEVDKLVKYDDNKSFTLDSCLRLSNNYARKNVKSRIEEPGKCFPIAEETYGNLIYLANQDEELKFIKDDVRLVIGSVKTKINGKNKRIGHAWLEIKQIGNWIPYETTNGELFDASLDSKSKYYSYWKMYHQQETSDGKYHQKIPLKQILFGVHSSMLALRRLNKQFNRSLNQ